MGLATLFNIPGTENDFAIFSFHNQDMHRQIVFALRSTKNIVLPLYPIDPIPLHDLAGWAIIHQALHNDFTQALGIGGVDLTDVDIKDPGQLAAWINLHGDEHRQASDILGLS